MRPEPLQADAKMSLVFYYTPMSTASITEGVLNELGTPCEHVKLDLKAGDAKKPEFLKINPNGRVPAIVHEGTPVWESAAITMCASWPGPSPKCSLCRALSHLQNNLCKFNRYLGETFGVAADLYPPPGPRRGEAMKWIVWSNVTLGEPGMRLAYAPPEGGDAADKARADIAGCLAILNDGLEGKAFLLGDQFSLVDTHVNAIVGWLTMMKVDVAPFSNVVAWKEHSDTRRLLAQQKATAMA